MRIARVIGKVTMTVQMPDILPGSYLIVRTCNRRTLQGKDAGNDETLVVYDCLAGREGDLIGLVEGREAGAPFYPRKVPFDCYNGCLLHDIRFEPVLKDRSEKRKTAKV